MTCPFCNIDPTTLAVDSPLAYARMDIFPVSKGHVLILPKRHVESFFDLTADERKAMFQIVEVCKSLLDYIYHPDGYNLVVNIGKAAGQSIPHAQLHLIPRY